jgi:hypothetical protein
MLASEGQPMAQTKPKRKRTQPDLVFGELPVQTINNTLGLELDPGPVVLTRAAQRHAARRHPEDYSQCLPHLAQVVLRPLYIGDDFKNEGKIELVGRVRAISSAILVAVALEADDAGHYRVCSFYPISEEKIEKRKERRHLLPARDPDRK